MLGTSRCDQRGRRSVVLWWAVRSQYLIDFQRRFGRGRRVILTGCDVPHFATMAKRRPRPNSAARRRRLIIFSSCFVETPPARCAAPPTPRRPMVIVPANVVARGAEEKFDKQDSLPPLIWKLHRVGGRVEVVVSGLCCFLADLTALPAASANSAFPCQSKCSSITPSLSSIRPLMPL